MTLKKHSESFGISHFSEKLQNKNQLNSAELRGSEIPLSTLAKMKMYANLVPFWMKNKI